MRITALVALSLLSLAGTASAQTLPGNSSSWSSGLNSMLGGAVPSLGKTGVGNAAGVLGYCVKNKLTNATSAQSVLGKLTGQPGVTDSPGYTAGQSGQLQTGSGMLSLNNLKTQVKTKACDAVLKHATSFL